MSEKNENTGPVPERNPFLGATFAERKEIREATESKQVDPEADKVEDKAISKATTKRAAKKS